MWRMRLGAVCAVVTVGILLLQASGASATTLCVPSTSILGCPTSDSASEPTIQAAANNAASKGDTVLIAPDSINGGPYKESVDDLGKSIMFIGDGPTKTIIQAQGSPGMNISPGSKVSGLGIEVHPTGGNTGLQLAGVATNVAITAQPGVTYAIGVDLRGGTFRLGSVSLPVNVSEPSGYAGAIGKGTVSDSRIAAAVGAAEDYGATYTTPNLIRDRILANRGVLEGGTAAPVVEDALIRTVGGPSPEVGVSTSPDVIFGSFAIRHSTIVGSASAGSTGVSADANGLSVPATTSVLMSSTIVRGYVNSIKASQESGDPYPASTTVTVRRSFYNPATGQTSGGAKINRDSRSGNHNPLFVDPAAGEFQLRAGSHAIDAGAVTLASGESSTDLAGHRRRIVGRKGDGLISDVGAYEFRPHVPRVHATASKRKITAGRTDTFHATGSDASPGDALSYRWSFGKGSSASGATAKHRFAKPGRYRVSVTVTDLDRFTATASITVTVRASH